MFSRYWRSATSLGLGLAGIALALLAILAVVTGGYLVSCKKPYSSPRYAVPNHNLPPRSSIPGAKHAFPQTIQKELRCDNPGSEKEYELCQPWRQAEAAEDAACISRWQFYAGLVGLGLIFVTFLANAIAGWGAKRAADIAQEALVLSQRAWIRINAIKIGSPLFFSEGFAHCGVCFDFSNVGNTPATKVMTHAKMLPFSNGGIVPDADARAFFDESRYDGGIGFGHTLFAGDRYPGHKGTTVIYGVRLRPEEMLVSDDGEKYASFFIAACVSYEFTSDPGRRHQTSTLLSLETVAGGSIRARDGVSFDKADLTLRPAILGSMDTAD